MADYHRVTLRLTSVFYCYPPLLRMLSIQHASTESTQRIVVSTRANIVDLNASKFVLPTWVILFFFSCRCLRYVPLQTYRRVLGWIIRRAWMFLEKLRATTSSIWVLGRGKIFEFVYMGQVWQSMAYKRGIVAKSFCNLQHRWVLRGSKIHFCLFAWYTEVRKSLFLGLI